MGLFGLLFGKHPAKKTSKKSETRRREAPQGRRQHVDDAGVVHVHEQSGKPLEFSQGDERKIYTYDGRPMKGLRTGSYIVLDVIREDVMMESIATGTVWDTNEFGDVALGYHGEAIGFLGVPRRGFELLFEAGYAPTIKAKKTGSYMPGIPALVAFVPNLRNWSESVERFGIDIPIDAEILHFNAYGDEWRGGCFSGDFDMVARMVDAPKKTQKQHVAIFNGNVLLCEYPATSGRYMDAIDAVGKSAAHARVSRHKESGRDEYHSVDLVILH